jgi:hypothetical protein
MVSALFDHFENAGTGQDGAITAPDPTPDRKHIGLLQDHFPRALDPIAQLGTR